MKTPKIQLITQRITSILLFALLGLGLNSGVIRAQQPAQPAPGAPQTVVQSNAPQPKIEFATPIYDFGRSKAGMAVKHDFIFTNTGEGLLEVTDVHPGCGCTTAGSWSRKVEPGQTGTIPIQFNAGGYSGAVTKGITVTCNDKSHPTVMLQIKGTIWKPVDAIPQYAIFNGTAEALASATSVIRIINNEDPPLTVSAPESNNKIFAAELRTNQPGKEFEVVIRIAGTLDAPRTQGLITVKTSSTNEPTINITTLASLQPTLVATPPQINLPLGVITNKLPVTIFIRNNGTSPLKLSDPEVNAAGVDVAMKEIEPGRYSSLTVTFPPEFTIAKDEKVELSVKTDHAQIPTFKVPVFQPPISTH